jgi:phage replication O-like protein O
MANPQPDNFTRISNELLEQLAKFRICGEAMQILLVIIRKTYGFNKKKDKISFSQFSKQTNIKRSNCFRAIKKLEKMNLITVKRNANSSIYSIQKDYDLWKIMPKEAVANTIYNESSSLASVIKTDYTSNTKSVIQTDNEVLSIRSQSVIHTDNRSVIHTDNNKRKLKKSLKESLKKGETSPQITSQKIIQLFKSYSKISNPNHEIHINPILDFIKVHPQELSNSDIMDCLVSVFSKLDKSKGVYMKYLIENIGKSFGVKVEEIIEKNKNPNLGGNQKQNHNLPKSKTQNATEYRKEVAKKIIKYSEFYSKNNTLFSTMEKYEIEQAFKNKSIMLVEHIFIEKMELIK